MHETIKHQPVPLSEVFLKGTLVHNPVLVELIGICPVVAAAVSLRAAVLLSCVSSLILIISQVVASAFLKKIVRWVRVAVYLLIGLAVAGPAMWLLEKYDIGVRITVGIYLPLLAANSLAALRCEKIAVRSSVAHSFWDAAAAGIGYSAVLLIAGLFRELLGSGTILDKPVNFLPAAPGLLMPFGGFLVLGFMAAALKALVMRRFPKYAKAMNLEISPTAVTLKLKSDEADALPAESAFAPAELPQTELQAESDAEAAAEADIKAEPEAEAEGEAPAGEPHTDKEQDSIPVQSTPAEADDLPEKQLNGTDTPLEQSVPAGPATSAPLPEQDDHTDTSGEPEADAFDTKLKELFHYLDELENGSQSDIKE
jgi:Na+-translocating ferredoxin:NAD+ oxidoreductase subunit E